MKEEYDVDHSVRPWILHYLTTKFPVLDSKCRRFDLETSIPFSTSHWSESIFLDCVYELIKSMGIEG